MKKKSHLQLAFTIVLSLALCMLCACSTTTAPKKEETPTTTLTTEEIFANIQAAYGEFFHATSQIANTDVEDVFGIPSDTYDEISAYKAAITLYPDVIIVAKASKDKTDDLVTALEDLRDKYVNDTLQYPMNISKIQSSTVVRNGDYVAYILAGQVDERDDSTDSDRLEFSKAQTTIGVDAFNASFK